MLPEYIYLARAWGEGRWMLALVVLCGIFFLRLSPCLAAPGSAGQQHPSGDHLPENVHAQNLEPFRRREEGHVRHTF